MFVNNFFIYFFVAFYLSAFSVKAYLLYPIPFDLSRTFLISFSFLTDCLAGISRNSYWVYHQQSVLSTPFFTFLQKILTVVKVLFFSRIPPHSCCEVHIMHLHDLFLLRTSASALRSGRRKTIIHRTMCAPPEAVSDGRSAPTTDTDLLPATYRGGSHFPIWCIWYRLQVQCQLYCPLRLHNGGRFTSNQAKHFRCTNMSFHIFFITPSQNGHEKQLWCFHTKGTQYKYFYLNTDIAKRLSS